MVVVFLIVHIILCILIYILMRLSVLKADKAFMPLICLVPVWGMAGAVILEFRSRGKRQINEEVGIEKLKINDEIYRSIIMEEDPVEDRVVPLEEALLINDSITRRELMMEVMYGNPDDYVTQLKEARMNDDTEVVHYAVTALAELQKEYDRYVRLLNRYLESGIAEGNDLDIKLRSYSEMLERKIKKAPERIMLRKEKARTDLKIGEYEAAYEQIRYMMDRWDQSETGYLLMLQYYSATGNRRGIDRTLDLIKRKKVYLTPQGRRTIGFWEKDKDGQEA